MNEVMWEYPREEFLKHAEDLDVPERTAEALADYVYRGVPTGGFLYAVLTNDLKGAIARADHQNIRRIVEIVNLLYNHVPAECWGDDASVCNWLDRYAEARRRLKRRGSD